MSFPRKRESSGTFVKNSTAPTARIIHFVVCCYQYCAPMGRLLRYPPCERGGFRRMSEYGWWPKHTNFNFLSSQSKHVIPALSRNLRHNPAKQKTRCPLSRAWRWKMYVIPTMHRNYVINYQNPPPTPPFSKWRGEWNNEISMSFLRKQESPTQPGTTKTRCPLTRAWRWIMYVIPTMNRNHVINHQNPPPTPPFSKWRGEWNNEISMSFLRKQESPTQPGTTKTRCPLSPRRKSSWAWQV